MGALASRLTETGPVPDGLGCGPPSRALGGWGGDTGPRTGASRAPNQRAADAELGPHLHKRSPSRAGGAGGRGVSVGGPREAVQSRGCQPAPAPREPGVCTRRNWGTTFSRCYEFYYPGEEGLEFVCLVLEGGKKRRKNPWDTNCHLPRQSHPPSPFCEVR